MEDIKFLALVLVGLFVIFLVSGSITGAITMPWTKVGTIQKTATVPISTSKSVDVTGTGCVKLTADQCNSICGGVVYYKKGCGCPGNCWMYSEDDPGCATCCQIYKSDPTATSAVLGVNAGQYCNCPDGRFVECPWGSSCVGGDNPCCGIESPPKQ